MGDKLPMVQNKGGFHMLMLKKEKAEVINRVVLLPVDEVYPNPMQPRKEFSDEALEELRQSIAANGLLQPITVRKREIGYELISGERRLRACKLNGNSKVPAIVVEVTDHAGGLLALIENIQRKDLSFLEEAIAIRQLMVEYDMTQVEISQKLGKSQPCIANKIRLLQLPAAVLQKVKDYELNERQTRALLRLQTQQQMEKAVEVIANRKYNSEETDRYIESLLSPKKKQNIKFCFKDVRIFHRTVERALKVINQSGIKAVSQMKESEDGVDYFIHIPISKT